MQAGGAGVRLAGPATLCLPLPFHPPRPNPSQQPNNCCQMPKGVPVATVAIGNAANAGLLAVRILAASDPGLLRRMEEYQAGMTDMVMGKRQSMAAEGWQTYGLNK